MNARADLDEPLLKVIGLKKHYPLGAGLFRARGELRAVDGVDFELRAGETLSLVGESGCGKSTVGRALLRFIDPTAGEIFLRGQRIDNVPVAQLRFMRRSLQIVFQDPFSSLNPRMRVHAILAEPILNFEPAISGPDLESRLRQLLEQVGLPRDSLDRFPHEFSGGQRQRIGIAKALAPKPDVIICDEAVSALDVSVKAQVVNLFRDLQDELGLALLFISHDLAIVEHLTHRVAVMYLGRIVETADRAALFSNPQHPYTQALLSSIPVPDPFAVRSRIELKGDLPNPSDIPSGCRFSSRCPYAFERCRIEEPQLSPTGEAGQFAACHLLDAKKGCSL